MNTKSAIARAKLSLEGLSVGDGFGELFFSPHTFSESELPPGRWRWTDDTHMALSIVEILGRFGHIEQDELAQAFARRFAAQPHRGYGRGAMSLLRQVAQGGDWRQLAPRLFGTGSYGNGAAMRIAPLGGFFSPDLDRAAREARLSAEVTHAHPEGQAGAVAVAVAAALAAGPDHPSGLGFLEAVLPFVPPGITHRRVELAMDIPADQVGRALRELGAGREISAQDTVPFCLWSAAYHLEDFEAALWWTAQVGGDSDTTCAIVGGIVALAAGAVPPEWVERREPLPEIG